MVYAFLDYLKQHKNTLNKNPIIQFTWWFVAFQFLSLSLLGLLMNYVEKSTLWDHVDTRTVSRLSPRLRALVVDGCNAAAAAAVAGGPAWEKGVVALTCWRNLIWVPPSLPPPALTTAAAATNLRSINLHQHRLPTS